MAKKASPRPQVKAAPRPVSAEKTPATAKEKPNKPLSLTSILCLVLAAVAFLVYANSLKDGYVLDDSLVTTNNTIVKQGFKGIPELLVTPRTKGYGFNKSDNYRPLTLVMFAAEYQLFGQNAAISHFFNILFFAGCVVLLFLFLDKLFERKKTTAVFIAALLFAIHPIHTEVVDNVKSRDEIMCFFFDFLSLNFLLDYMQQGKLWQLLAGTGTLFLAFLSKETVITFLAINPLVFFFYRNENRMRAVYITVGTMVVAAIFIMIRTTILNKYNCNTTDYLFIDNALVNAPTYAIRIATAMLILGKYLKLLLLPFPLNNDYGYNSIPFTGFGNAYVLLSLAAYIAITVAGVYRLLKNRKDPWAFAALFFLITLSLFSNIPFLIGSAMGERFLFFASVGFCLAIGLAIDRWIIKVALTVPELIKNKLAVGILLPVCLLLSGLTIARNNDWVDNYTLYKTDLSKAPEDSRLNFYTGDELIENHFANETDPAKQKQIFDESIGYLKKAVAIYPEYSDAYTELGKAYYLVNSYDSAMNYFVKAMITNPFQNITATNLFTACAKLGKYREAIAAYKQAVAANPQFTDAFYYLGTAYMQLNNADSAIYFLNKAIAIDPKYPRAEMQVGVAYSAINRFDLAGPHFIKAMEQTPDDPNVVNNVGVAYMNTGKYPEAINMFKKTVALDPKYAEAYSKMGRCYFQLKQFEAALATFNQAITADPKDVKDIPYVAMSYQAMGKMDLALKYEAVAKQYYPTFKLP